MNFQKHFTNRLFMAENQDEDRGFLAFVVPEDVTPPSGEMVTLGDALTNTQYVGSFVFGARGPEITTEDEANAFLDIFFKDDGGLVPKFARRFIWLTDPADIITNTVYQASINSNGTAIQNGFEAALSPSNWLTFKLEQAMNISLDNSTLLLQDCPIQLSGLSSPEMMSVMEASLPFSGRQRGCIQFTAYLERQWLFNEFRCAFHFLIPNSGNGDKAPPLSWLPFIDPSLGQTDYLGFNISIDPSDPYNEVIDPCNESTCTVAEAYASRRTYFDFTGKNSDEQDVTLETFYRTTFDAKVALIPSTAPYNARLVINLDREGSLKNAHFAPEGDFILSLPTATESYNHNLRCGLSGTEFFKITPQTETQNGDILRFLSRQPAFALNFLSLDVVASPVGPPMDPTASPFDATYRTSWATMVDYSGTKILSYVSQPKGTALYGLDTLIQPTFTDLFGHTTPGFQLTANDPDVFPMFPYAGWLESGSDVMTAEELQKLEKIVISPQRRAIVSKLSKTARQAADGVTGDLEYHTTPSGLIAKTTESGDGSPVRWEEVQLGWNEDNGTRYSMAFEVPPDPLVDALQSSDVFLVAANKTNFDDFQNIMSIGSWEMQANIGEGQTYGDYRNVMIFKGRQGKLYDPDNPDKSLVANPQKWTQAQEFAVPTTSSGQGEESEDEAQLVILSQWLQTYFERSLQQQGNPYFEKFNNIATQDSWTGILFLRVDINSQPDNLKGILAGVTAPDAFNAHHLGLEISPVAKGDKGPSVENPSSIFGLIYYVDPDFSDSKPIKSIAPTNSDIYNFRLLSLKVLFENTAVKSFESYAQLTLNKLFGSTVTKTYDPDNIYKNVLLAGSLQINNGKAVYSLSSQKDDAFYLDNNIINKVEITDVTLSTRSGDDATILVSWFGMRGFLDFFKLENAQNDEEAFPFDVFSFGNELGQDDLTKGLIFSNLGIRMSFPAKDPDNETLTFDTSEITFDLSRSTPRADSLYLNMVLDLESLVLGTEDKGPKESGYLDVIPDLRLGGVSGGDWYGLRFKLHMGTPGELAGKVNLDSYLLLSWSPDSRADSGYKAGIGISLPGTGGGAKLISLQNVMKLSLGQIRLRYVKVEDKDQYSFLLLFTEIALKFLGLLKIPPSGNTLFYLFGNPEAGDKASGLGWYAMYKKDDNRE